MQDANTRHIKNLWLHLKGEIFTAFSQPACASLTMCVFSHLIIAFACVLLLWLIAGPKKRGNQQHLICPVCRSATSFLCLFSTCLIQSTLVTLCRFENEGAAGCWLCQFLLDSWHLLGNRCWICRTLCMQSLFMWLHNAIWYWGMVSVFSETIYTKVLLSLLKN